MRETDGCSCFSFCSCILIMPVVEQTRWGVTCAPTASLGARAGQPRWRPRVDHASAVTRGREGAARAPSMASDTSSKSWYVRDVCAAVNCTSRMVCFPMVACSHRERGRQSSHGTKPCLWIAPQRARGCCAAGRTMALQILAEGGVSQIAQFSAHGRGLVVRQSGFPPGPGRCVARAGARARDLLQAAGPAALEFVSTRRRPA